MSTQDTSGDLLDLNNDILWINLMAGINLDVVLNRQQDVLPNLCKAVLGHALWETFHIPEVTSVRCLGPLWVIG